ncbi:FAD-dependent oxidoreductase [Coraliomargarita sp. SDUM461004]|uniref:FAD-dependent oxidoreductase n=1 Tax=Thalassobacterium sedimentorum TaxID=3041258 RepID=A0ABU1AKU7_9BACT|nr:FAD-dependent oxidoreductase [Coraliomargarita sp. SDUM461004]MDQ8194808.1 FAD-dependent oxidoreductase [Coraliomargarita sp. SDUM461004]
MKSEYSKHNLECDILVAGGGAAGVPAALAAARQGRKVILVQDRPVLGGNASSEVRMHIVGADSYRPNADLVLEPRESGIVEEIRLENALRNAQRSPSMFDLILYEKCRAEPNLTLMLNTSVVAAEVEGRSIRRVLAMRASTEDSFEISANVFVDCTGDGGLGVAAGAAFLRGRENKEFRDESLALDQADEKTLGSTLLIMARRHEQPMPFIAPPWARKFTEEDLKLRPHATAGADYGLEYGFWWAEWGGHLDTVKDNEYIRDELLGIIMGIWDHIKNDGDHGADNWALDWFGAIPGKRESRRFIGQYILTQDDVLESKPQMDAIAYGGWPVDIHPPEGVDAPEQPPGTPTEVPYLYDIPLRCCIGRDLDNLMFAGRNISATHVAFASTRVMATCGELGEGVGIAASVAVELGVEPGQLCETAGAVEEIQQRILKADAYLIGKEFTDTENLAAVASITASSEQKNGAATNVISSQNRAVMGALGGIEAGREVPGTHRWMSDPKVTLPAWIELRWPEPVTASTLEMTFDTGLHRLLTLSQSDGYACQMCWGKGQPECVKTYRVEVDTGSGWEELAKVDLNWQRQCKHTLDVVKPIQAIRILVDESWDLDHARIIHLGVYA